MNDNSFFIYYHSTLCVCNNHSLIYLLLSFSLHSIQMCTTHIGILFYFCIMIMTTISCCWMDGWRKEEMNILILIDEWPREELLSCTRNRFHSIDDDNLIIQMKFSTRIINLSCLLLVDTDKSSLRKSYRLRNNTRRGTVFVSVVKCVNKWLFFNSESNHNWPLIIHVNF